MRVRSFLTGLVGLVGLLLTTSVADSLEVNAGIGVGGSQVARTSRLSIAPHLGLVFQPLGNGFLVSVHNTLNILPGTGQFMGIGFNDLTVIGLGYAFKDLNMSLGGSLAAYYMPVCGPTHCGPVQGVSPGGHARVDYYTVGPVGISVNVEVGWYGAKSSKILPGGLVVLATAGPILRWRN